MYFLIILIVLVIISLINVYPVILNVINHDINLEDALFGKFIIKYFHGTRIKDSISWISFLILDIIAISFCLKLKSNILKILLIVILIYLPILFVFPLTTLHNIYLDLTIPKNKPFIENINVIFPQNIILEQNFDIYQKELNLFMNKQSDITCVHSKTPGFIIGKTENKCWRTLQIKTANQFIDNFENICPGLYKVLNINSVNNAFLSILDPCVNIPKHTGYSKIYLRYHLGIDIPKTENKPFIICGNEKYTWEEGKGVIFDDMYEHYVENTTPYKRVVLYIDLIRPEIINDNITKIILNMLNTNIFIKRYNSNQHKQKNND